MTVIRGKLFTDIVIVSTVKIIGDWPPLVESEDGKTWTHALTGETYRVFTLDELFEAQKQTLEIPPSFP